MKKRRELTNIQGMSRVLKTALPAAALLTSFLAPAPASAQLSDRADGMRFVPNVVDQFSDLTE